VCSYDAVDEPCTTRRKYSPGPLGMLQYGDTRGLTAIIPETQSQKIGHVTFFWNGNRGGKFDKKLETYQEVGSNFALEMDIITPVLSLSVS